MVTILSACSKGMFSPSIFLFTFVFQLNKNGLSKNISFPEQDQDGLLLSKYIMNVENTISDWWELKGSTLAIRTTVVPIKIYLYKRADMDGLRDHLACYRDSFLSSDHSHMSVNDMWVRFKSEVLAAI